METLSDKIYNGMYSEPPRIAVDDIKEFIKKLKEANHSNFLYGKFADVMDEVIDKLSGDVLSGDSE